MNLPLTIPLTTPLTTSLVISHTYLIAPLVSPPAITLTLRPSKALEYVTQQTPMSLSARDTNVPFTELSKILLPLPMGHNLQNHNQGQHHIIILENSAIISNKTQRKVPITYKDS